ncbi:MAG: NUDIX hydrolase [Victivallales bacterium]|nr:NUDIX hydrolase [Victivallales bacterium]MCF7889515.1 NUDIX hydrolase [Victivallales bacterium]
MKNTPETLNCSTVYKGKWLQFEKIVFRDIEGNIRKWEYVKRTQDRGAVVIIAKLKPSERVILIRQYRPPVESYIFEFPAGLIDDGESAETAALRELYEETGYCGRIISLTQPVYNTPGLTDETVSIAFVVVDETAVQNKNPQQNNEPTEDIEVYAEDIGKLTEFLQNAENEGDKVDAKLMSFALFQNF